MTRQVDDNFSIELENTDIKKGLTSQQVEMSRERYGANVLTPPAKESMWKLLIEKFNDPLIKVLLVALALSFGVAIYEINIGAGFKTLLEPIGILVAVLLATVVGFLVELNANKKFELLNKVNDEVAVKVIRGGKVRKISRQLLVKGDIVMLETGEEVPADGLLLRSTTLSINESTLTGEPMVRKSHRPEDMDAEATYPTNEVYRGTTVIEGNCVMRVMRVGDHTEYGKVYCESQIDNGVKTPLMIQLEKLGKTISWLGYSAAALLFVGRLFSYFVVDDTWNMLEFVEYFLTSVMLAVTLIVVSVPEGLPMSVTLSLALSMRRMLMNNNLVRKMHACETMGAATVICTDKTGTLTQNQMQVYAAEFFGLKDGNVLGDDEASTLVKEGIAANTTAFLEDDGNRLTALGNPTEGALLLWINAQGADYMQLRDGAEVETQLPFSTERKYMATVVRSSALRRRVLYVKGASEIIYNYCSGAVGGVERADVAARLLGYQQKAMRTLGFAYKILADDENPIAKGALNVQGMTFMGIVAISDPVRSDVPAAISECMDAGIKVKIVTGDTPGTAREIGRQVGIVTDADDASVMISGPEFAALSDEDAAKVSARLKVMSRARPQDKSRLVSLLQGNGEVVAVTGDGTNDAPALNAAQVGLSMGDGTSVAKEASDITIIDNSFASIAKAVLWGRSLYLNIQRFIVFQLTVNVIACCVVTLGSFLGKQAPLSVTQMLWVNLIMDTFAALAMASLPATQRVMKARPRRKGEPIITRNMWYHIAETGVTLAVLLCGYLLYLKGTKPDGHFDFRYIFDFGHAIDGKELTMFFTAFVFVQFWNMLNVKSFMSGHLALHKLRECAVFFVMWGLIFVGQVLISMYGGEFFKLVDINLTEVLAIAGITSIVAVLGQARYALALRRKK